MTIIQPNKSRRFGNIFAVFLAVVLGAFIWWGLLIYNAAVDLEHNIALTGEKISHAELVNAELKNEIYRMLEPGNLEALAEKRGLLKVKRVEYMERKSEPSWVFASF